MVRVEPPTSAKPGDKAVITGDGGIVGWIGGSCAEPSVRREAQEILSEGTPRLIRIEPGDHTALHARAGEVVLATTCPSGGTLEIFLEPHLARPQLITIGRSPIARTLLRLAALVSFRTCAVHPGASLDEFPAVDQLLTHLDLAPAAGADSWVVVATMGHYDEEALEAALHTNAAYVGLIASRRRRNAIIQILRDRGWPGDALASIVNPAGRTLADSPEEIALSVLADVVARRNRRKRTALPATPANVFATDPVCGMAVEIAGARYRSGDVYFCGPGCLAAFEGNPEGYTVQSL